ncbi:ribonucleoside triphosphate reductase [Candidatus Dojkabacteria bacterium]|nr:ribonucleoside triphosphate reductase [Candidatus Dojkabacteria bacterium]
MNSSQAINAKEMVEAYLRQSDWQVNQDANVHYSFPGLMNYLAEEITKKYSLSTLIPAKASKAHISGDIYIHDLGKHVVGYCTGWDTRLILTRGLSGVPDKCTSGPAKHLASALDHLSRFILIVCNEWAGAQAISSVDTYMAPFIRNDKLTYAQVKNCVQRFMYDLSLSTRYGGQIPFSNITLDWTVPEDLKNQQVIIGGKVQKETYKEFQKEMDIFNKALLEVYKDGDFAEQPFPFPIPTYNITRDFNWNTSNSNLLFEMTAKYGMPYFQNFVNSDLKPGDVRAMCCRLQMNMKELTKKTGGLWGYGASTGSIGVVDINLPRIGYISNGDKKKFFKLVDQNMKLAKIILENKRKILDEHMRTGLMPYSKVYLGTFNKHFSTIGLVGMNETLINFGSPDLTTTQGISFALEILNHMKSNLLKYQDETGNLYNLEATPNESAAYSLARKDKLLYKNIVTAGNIKNPYYTNSSQLPVGYTDDIFEALELQETLQTAYTGGTVFHTFLGERVSTAEECKKLVKKIAENYKIPYFSITPTFSICPVHGYIRGEAKECPHKNGSKCKEIPLIYSRVVGYYRPINQWNNGKRQEYSERKTYKVSNKK